MSVSGRPSSSSPGFVVSTTTTKTAADNEMIDQNYADHSSPYISLFHVTSHVQFRYAHTLVTSYVKNPTNTIQEISFAAVIPNDAFISNFTMVLPGEEHVAEVKEKEEARREYTEAVSRGSGAGLVSQDVRDANRFTVTTNVEAGDKVEFRLTYEELLQRKQGQYHLAINVNPGQIVDDLKIEVFINESLPISIISVPELKQSNEVDFEPDQESQVAVVERDIDGDESRASVVFEPSREYQEEAGEQGLAGQLLVNYDMDRKGQVNEGQVIDGYFVHYFTPENLPVLPKHVIFVLDVSGSMDGEKISQLKDAMFTILDDMTEKDYFNIITFSSGTEHWSPATSEYTEEVHAIQATKENRDAAIEFARGLDASGGTNINDALLEGLRSASLITRNEDLPRDLLSTIVFLSDCEATEGETRGTTIRDNVKTANVEMGVPIYSLGFGRNADFNLIKGISNDADGFSKHIYEDSDAALQLENFFLEIANPVLSDLKFQYVGGQVNNDSLTDLSYHCLFKGGEFVVSGKLNDNALAEDDDGVLQVIVEAGGQGGETYQSSSSFCLTGINPQENIIDYDDASSLLPFPCITISDRPRSQAQNFLQNIHAFLNIRQLLKRQDEVSENEDEESPKEKALRLSLSNNFVTEFTSLVVVRPDEDPKIATIDKGEVQHSSYQHTNTYGYGGIVPLSLPVPKSSGLSYYKSGGGSWHDPCPSCKILRSSSYNYASYASYDYDGSGMDYEYDTTFDSAPQISTTTTPAGPCSGSLTLFSKTYNRGENVTVTEDTPDLDEFNNQLVSALVEGDCCWAVYTRGSYSGDSEVFRP